MGEKRQPRTADVRTLTVTALVLIAVLVGLVFAVYGLSSYLEQRVTGEEGMAAGGGRRIPPPPRLQADPEGDLRAHREPKRRRLDGYGWVNRAAGIAHIPIEKAMEMEAAEGEAGER